ncbi:MAG: hypothetical protein FJ333_04865, partial [Sphingomonadales bacterium]|nr:hypothetical protein [Sphingomonadales bacterium]
MKSVKLALGSLALWMGFLYVPSTSAQDGRSNQSVGSNPSDEFSPKVSQEYTAFLKLLRNKDTAAQRVFLAQWSGIGQQDPEFYVCYANYYMNLAKKEVINMTTVPPETGEESFAINDSVGNVVGYLRSQTVMDAELSAQS